jgi:YD repeat-containing protein
MTSLEFRPDGQLAHQHHRNPDGSEWTTTYEYNPADRLFCIRNESSAGQVNLTFHEYDAVGRLTRVFTRPHGTSEHTLETYEYDSEGRKSKTRLADPRIHAWGVEGSNTVYPSKGAAKVVTSYNHRDQPAELLFQDQSGGLLSRVDFQYDLDGNLIEETQTDSAAIPSGLTQEATAAHLEAVRALIGPIHKVHTSRGYNLDDEGRVSEVPSEERVTRSETVFRYEYDARGNWTMKAIQSPGAELSTIESRTITYFNAAQNETPGDPIRSPQGPASAPKIHP